MSIWDGYNGAETNTDTSKPKSIWDGYNTTATKVAQSNKPIVTKTKKPKDTGLMGILSGVGGGLLKGAASAAGSVASTISSAITGSAENDFTKGTKNFQEGINKWQSKSGANGIADFVGNLPGGIVSGVVDPANYMVRGVRNTPDMIAASIAANSKDKYIRQEGIKAQKEIQNKQFGKDVTAQGDKGMLLEAAARPAENILNVATGGLSGGIEKQVSKQIVKQGAKDVLKTAGKAAAINVASGVPISVAEQLARGQKVTPESVAKDAATQALIGAVIAGVPKAIHIKAANRLADLKANQNLGENVIPKLTDEQMKSMTPQQIKVASELSTNKIGVTVKDQMSDVDYVKEYNKISKSYESDMKKIKDYNPAKQQLAQDSIDERYQTKLQELDNKFSNGTKVVGGEKSDIQTVKDNVQNDLGIKLTDNQAASIAENAPKTPEVPIDTINQQVSKTEPEASVVTPETTSATSEMATSGRALSTEQEAIKQGLTSGIENKSKYSTTSYKDNKITAEELVKNNRQGALDIIEGRSEASSPQIQETYKQLLKYTKENKDLDVYERLVRSDAAEKVLSESAQVLGQSGYDADPSNPVARVREVKKALESRAAKRTTATKDKVSKEIKGEVDKVLKVSENKSWIIFLEGIKC